MIMKGEKKSITAIECYVWINVYKHVKQFMQKLN